MITKIVIFICLINSSLAITIKNSTSLVSRGHTYISSRSGVKRNSFEKNLLYLNRGLTRLDKLSLNTLHHPLFKPQGSEYRCNKCEIKRTKCWQFSVATYGLCYLVKHLGGNLGYWVCAMFTMYRDVDCWENSIVHCFLKDCGYLKYTLPLDF